MSHVFTSQLGLKIWKTNIRAQKIDNNTLKTYKILVSIFSVSNKNVKKKILKKNFLLANIKPDIMLWMFFQTMSYIDIDFHI